MFLIKSSLPEVGLEQELGLELELQLKVPDITSGLLKDVGRSPTGHLGRPGNPKPTIVWLTPQILEAASVVLWIEC